MNIHNLYLLTHKYSWLIILFGALHYAQESRGECRSDASFRAEYAAMAKWDINKLRDALEKGAAASPDLSSLVPGYAPPYWVSDMIGYAIFKTVLWPAAHISPQQSVSPQYEWGGTADVSVAAADIISAVYAYREICQRKSTLAWDWVQSRSENEPNLLDLCIMAQIMWSTSLRVLPSDPETPPPAYTPNTPLPTPLPPDNWLIPEGTFDQWRNIYSGTNGIYRLIAVKGLQLWADTNGINHMITELLSDPYLSIRYEALRHIDVLSPAEQLNLLEEYTERESTVTNQPKVGREAARWLNDNVSWKLNELNKITFPQMKSVSP